MDQLDHVFYTTNGEHGEHVQIGNSSKFVHLAHFGEKGGELQTLHLMHKFCQSNPTSKVLYFHNKGSYHYNTDNQNFLQLLNCYVLNPHCIEYLPNRTRTTVATSGGHGAITYANWSIPPLPWTTSLSSKLRITWTIALASLVDTLQRPGSALGLRCIPQTAWTLQLTPLMCGATRFQLLRRPSVPRTVPLSVSPVRLPAHSPTCLTSRRHWCEWVL